MRARNGTVRRSRSGIVFIGVALTAFAALFVLVRNERTAEFDHEVTVRVQRVRAPWFARLMTVVSWAGFPPQSRILPWTLPAVLLILGRPLEAFFQLMGWGTGGISFLVKRTMRRPRPNHPAINVVAARIGGTSFPSGHVINYMGVYGFFAFLCWTYLKPAALRRLVVGTIVSLLALVGPSRIYLGHHWLTDTLASYLLGSSYLLALTAVYRRVKQWTA
ncbi:MAG TPA: phosphatase PAP2 family protein [Thermomicrobiales bacterium]|nr:phosphatase PAP2 family protein [Thermomicrobiales bacterium]